MTGFDALNTGTYCCGCSIRKSVDLRIHRYLPTQRGRCHMKKRVALYLRVSTKGQSVENQRRELEAVAAHRGWDVVAVYQDAGISGAKGRDKRPGFDRLLKDATRRQFDLIGAWSVDRLGRSLQDLVASLGELHAVGVDLYLHQQAVDTTTPAGKALFQMMGVFAEFEREIIRERVRAGLARAKAKGTKLGAALSRGAGRAACQCRQLRQARRRFEAKAAWMRLVMERPAALPQDQQGRHARPSRNGPRRQAVLRPGVGIRRQHGARHRDAGERRRPRGDQPPPR